MQHGGRRLDEESTTFLDEQARQRLLLEAVVTMAADLTLDGVLQRIVAIACELGTRSTPPSA